jgi:hypothetical protein
VRRRARSVLFLTLGARWIAQDRHLLDADGRETGALAFLVPRAELAEPRISAGFSTARAYPFSVSTEDGTTGAVSARWRRHVALSDSQRGVEGVDGSLWDLTAYLQAYRGIGLPGFADHVLALRLAGGTAGGPGAGGGHFGLGGDERFFSVRGHPSGSLRFSTAWAASAEWRFPVATVNRGLGAWPVHADRLSGAVFFDASGGSRDPESGGWGGISSFGVEGVLTYSLWFDEMARFRVGAAFPTDSLEPTLHVGSSWSF